MSSSSNIERLINGLLFLGKGLTHSIRRDGNDLKLKDVTTGEKTLAELLAGPDNPTGALYISTPADTSATTTPQKIAGTSTTLRLNGFDSAAACRLRYTGATTKWFEVTLTVSLNSGSAKTAYLTLAKDGATIAASEERGYCDAGRMQPISLTYQIELATNAYIEPFLRVDSGTATISSLLHMSIHAL